MTNAPESGKYVDFDEYVGLKLEKARATIRTTDFITSLAAVAAVFLGYLLIFVTLDQWVIPGGFNILTRCLLLVALLGGIGGWIAWKVGMPWMQSVNRLFVAREIERSEPQLKSNLLNLIDMKSAG